MWIKMTVEATISLITGEVENEKIIEDSNNKEDYENLITSLAKLFLESEV